VPLAEPPLMVIVARQPPLSAAADAVATTLSAAVISALVSLVTVSAANAAEGLTIRPATIDAAETSRVERNTRDMHTSRRRKTG